MAGVQQDKCNHPTWNCLACKLYTCPRDQFLARRQIAYKKNFEQKLTSMKSLLNLWFQRNLTLYGHITVLKSLAISKLVYNTSVLTFPPKFITLVNQAITQFVWNKTVKIKHKTMIGPKELGGLDLPDFDIINDSLKVTWVKRLNDSTETSIWSQIPLYYLQDVGGLFIPSM